MANVLIKVRAEAFALIDVGDQSEWDLRDGAFVGDKAIPKILDLSATDYTWIMQDRNSPLPAPFELTGDGDVRWVGYQKEPQ